MRSMLPDDFDCFFVALVRGWAYGCLPAWVTVGVGEIVSVLAYSSSSDELNLVNDQVRGYEVPARVAALRAVRLRIPMRGYERA